MKKIIKTLYIMLIICTLASCMSSNPPITEVPVEEEQAVLHEEENQNIPSKIAYITIDDGPSRENTPEILNTLKEKKIKATFFILPHIGLDDIYQRIINEGHEIANHSYSHDYDKLYSSSANYFKEDIITAQNYIKEKFEYTTVSFRFPGGAMGRKKEILEPRKQILTDLDYRWFDWNVTTGDTDPSPAGKNVEALVNNVVLNTNNKDKLIVLMHDSKDKIATPKALPLIIEQLTEQGYRFDILRNY